MKSESIRKEIEEAIAYNNAPECIIVLRSEADYGEFFGSRERSFKIGYESEVQFELNKEEYEFLGLEAVSQNDKTVSRADCVEIKELSKDKEKGIYKYSVKLLTDAKDILIRPNCLELLKIKGHTPEGKEAQTTDKSVVISFNMPVEEADVLPENSIFNYEQQNFSILYKNITGMTEYFEAPVYNAQNYTLTLTPKAMSLKKFMDDKHLTFIDLTFSFEPTITVVVGERTLSLKQNAQSKFTVRYKADTEVKAPVEGEFYVTRDKITLENAASSNEIRKFKLAPAIDITAAQLPAEDIQKNRASNGAVYIYGSYFDEDSGVKDVIVSERMLQNNGELSTANNTTFNPETASEIAQFTSDGQGNTSFVIKYDFATLGKAYVIDVIVRDNCDNRSIVKTVSVFVPLYGEALGENFNYLKNKPDYEHEDLTLDQYSAELKNLKIYPTSFAAYSDVKIPVEDLTIYCEYKDKTGADKKQKFNLNEGENPYWNCLLNVDSLANLNTKITIYDGDFIYDQRDFKFPARTAFTIDWLYDDYLTSSDPRYQIRILAEPGHSVFGVKASPSDDNPDGYVFEIEYPLPSYEQLDIYTRYKWCLETKNQQGLYSDAVRFEDILEEYNTDISAVGIKSIDEDKSSWHTNGGYFVYTITLADDTWEEGKYEQVFYDICYVGDSVNDPQEIQKNEYTITVKIPLSELTEKWANIIITGKKGFKKSSAYKSVGNVDAEDYDVVPPNVYASHASYDYWTFNVNEYTGSGAKEADFTVGNETYHVDETNSESDDRLTVKIPAKLIEELRAQNGSVEYTACDNAGNTVTGVLDLDDGGQGDNFKLRKTCTTGVSVSFDRYTYEYYDTKTKFYFYEFDDSDPETEDDWKTTPSVSSTDDINYVYAGENNDIFRYQKYINGLPESKFLKVVGYNYIYFPAPQYVYLGDWGSGDYDLLMPNASSKKSVIICSDAPVYIHTLVTKCPYETCKDWDASVWEYYKDDIGKRILNFTADKEVGGNLVTGDHNPKIYKIPEDIEKGSCYCVIAHFANGDVLMSEVMQK